MKITEERWHHAQEGEGAFWQGGTLLLLHQVCADFTALHDRLGHDLSSALFEDKDVLDIGVGPLALSPASFYFGQREPRRLVKLEPLPRIRLADTPAGRIAGAQEFLSWLEKLTEKGEYVQKPGEQMEFRDEFDTVVTYNVLDHVRDPESVIRKAHQALRPGGHLLVSVDCRSLLGFIKFEYGLRRFRPHSFLVQAHPYSFVPGHVTRLIESCGFRNVRILGVPNMLTRIAGSAFQPIFIARK